MTDYRDHAGRSQVVFEYDSARLDGFEPIESYGAIGNARSLALVAPHGSIDWACFPRPDADPVFWSLLDRKLGGLFSVRPTIRPFVSRQEYEPETNVLRTEFFGDTGVARLTDVMPYWGDKRTRISEIHRRVICMAGEIELEVRFRPRFGWSGQPASLRTTRHGVTGYDPDSRDHLALVGRLEFKVDPDTGEARARTHLKQGEGFWLVAAWNSGTENVEAFRSSELLQRTRRYWRQWVGRCNYQGSWRDEVVRSALALRLMFYEPTGAMVAAGTTSLPEVIGGERNWDYRYTWIRDSAYALQAMFPLGYTDEATDFFHWLEGALHQKRERLRLMYSVTGESGTALDERQLDHLEGYEGSSPVRIGNGAATQSQADIFGAMLEAAWHLDEHGGHITMGMWRRLRTSVNRVCRIWKDADHGLWEARLKPRHYTHSKVMCWVALDRGIRLAEKLRAKAFYRVWRRNRDAIQKQILEQGFDEKVGAFTQTLGDPALDASALMIGHLGLVPPDDPRMLSTIDRIQSDLTRGPFVWRYQNADGLDGDEGAFFLCSFWLVEALADAGRLSEAVDLHRQLMACSNHLGLMAEEYDPGSGRQLGNFPQAFSHLGLLNATLAINEAMLRTEHGQAMSWLARPRREDS